MNLLLCCLLVPLVASIPVSEFQKYGSEAGDSQLLPEDDQSSDEIVLRDPFVFYESTYFSVFVNTNGLISFLTEIPYFYNAQFPLDYPTIAPFYSDVDLSEGGNVWFRQSSEPQVLSWAQDVIIPNFAIARRYRPSSVFIATWENVAPFGAQTDNQAKTNTYQVVLVTDGKESFVIMQYADGGLQWLQGGGKTSGLPDAIAQTGFISETKTLFTLKGSGTDQARNLDKWSNIGEPGVWVFRAGKLQSGENIQSPDIRDGAPLAQQSLESNDTDIYLSCATGGSVCHSVATCLDYQEGFCCECDQNYYGNGINCLKRDSPIRVTGKVNGNINGIDIKDADLHSYVLSNEGRTYTAISRVKQDVGFDLQSLIAVGEGIAWLFAVPVDGVKNGFIATGGTFNRSVEIDFPQTGHKAFVHQTFEGLDVFSNVAVATTVSGSIPSVPIGSEIEVDSFQEEITRVNPGSLRARSNRSFRLKGQSLSTPFSVETFINYDECAFEPTVPEEETLRLKIADNIFIRYDEAESIVRYSFSAKIGTLEDVDPCILGREECGPNSECIVDVDSYRCACEQGYDHVFDSLLNVAVCLDVNECELARDRCDPEAVCINSPGSYACKCRAGFMGDGYHCESEMNCNNVGCDQNAVCDMINRQPVCTCNSGYRGDGFFCAPNFEDESCHVANDCATFGVCVPVSTGFECRCLQGYVGDGYTCNLEREQIVGGAYGQQEVPAPHVPAVDDHASIYEEIKPECVVDLCWCPTGYVFDRHTGKCQDDETFSVQVEFGRPKPVCDEERCGCPGGFVYNELYMECDPIDKAMPCNIVNNCHSNALCTYDSESGDSRCHCNAGFSGDGFYCEAVEVSCDQVDVCHIDAECLFDDIQLQSVCICKPGYMGDGLICTPQDECNSIEECDANAQCLFDGQSQRFTCRCNSGFEGDGFICTAPQEDGCNVRNICDVEADCVFDTYAAQYRCQCAAGFEGDGSVCRRIEVGCNLLNNCAFDAECAYNSDAGGYRCKCLQDFEGDGMTCNPTYSCAQDRSLCHPQANCQLSPITNNYMCVCASGYSGDGSNCEEAQKFEKDLILISRGLSVLRMPINPDEGHGTPIYVDPFMTAVGADIDCMAGRFYWTDIDSKSIRSSKYDGSDKMPLITVGDIGFPEDVAVDWVARNVFWTDSTNDVIAVASIDGGMKRTVIEGDLVNPRGIAVHPGLGLIFWSDWNRQDPKIESSGMDGTNRRKLVSGQENVLLPNSLVVDHETGMVCWADAGTHRIECVGVDGYGRNRVIAEDISYPFGLTLHYRSFYYSDWTDKLIHEVNKYTGEEISQRKPPLGGSGKLYGIAAVPETCPPVTNICQSNRGNCDAATICLPNGRGGRTCSCTDKDIQDGICPQP